MKIFLATLLFGLSFLFSSPVFATEINGYHGTPYPGTTLCVDDTGSFCSPSLTSVIGQGFIASTSNIYSFTISSGATTGAPPTYYNLVGLDFDIVLCKGTPDFNNLNSYQVSHLLSCDYMGVSPIYVGSSTLQSTSDGLKFSFPTPQTLSIGSVYFWGLDLSSDPQGYKIWPYLRWGSGAGIVLDTTTHYLNNSLVWQGSFDNTASVQPLSFLSAYSFPVNFSASLSFSYDQNFFSQQIDFLDVYRCSGSNYEVPNCFPSALISLGTSSVWTSFYGNTGQSWLSLSSPTSSFYTYQVRGYSHSLSSYTDFQTFSVQWGNQIIISTPYSSTTLEQFLSSTTLQTSPNNWLSNLYTNVSAALLPFFPFNIPFKLLEQWNLSSSATVPSWLSWIPIDSEGNIRYTFSQNLVNTTQPTTAYIIGPELASTSPEAVQYLGYCKVLMDYLFYFLFALGLFVVGRDIYDDLV